MRRAVGLRCEAALCLAICLSWLSVYILSFPLQLCLCPPLLSFMISFEPIPFHSSLPLPASLPACLPASSTSSSRLPLLFPLTASFLSSPELALSALQSWTD